MTASTTTAQRCQWCSRRIEDDQATGRRKRYCSQSCRQRAYEKRRSQTNGPIDKDSVVVRRVELEHLQDRLYALRCAVDDLSAALGEGDTDGVRSVAREVVAAAGDLDRLWISP